MFARVFSCYVYDRLADMGRRNDYLYGLSNSFSMIKTDGTVVRAYPIGEERKIINQAFDDFIQLLKDKTLFQNHIIPIPVLPVSKTSQDNKNNFSMKKEKLDDKSKQLVFVFDNQINEKVDEPEIMDLEDR